MLIYAVMHDISIYIYIHIYMQLSVSFFTLNSDRLFVGTWYVLRCCIYYVQICACITLRFVYVCMYRFKHVQCANISVYMLRAGISLCVLCSLLPKTSSLRSEHVSLRSVWRTRRRWLVIHQNKQEPPIYMCIYV